jgi:hypothetical protein
VLIAQLRLSLLAIASIAPQALALEFGGGGGIVTQGDDRLSPAIQGWMKAGRVLLSSTFIGEKNSAFAQQIAFPHMSYVAPLGKSKTIAASLGVGGMVARTSVQKFDENGNSSRKVTASAGLALGLNWTPQLSRRIRFRLSWDSLFIPPGISVLYITYGHMQSVTAGLGWDL